MHCLGVHDSDVHESRQHKPEKKTDNDNFDQYHFTNQFMDITGTNKVINNQ